MKIKYIAMMVMSGALLSACELPSFDDDIDHSATTTSATSTSDTSGSSSTGASSTTNDANSPLASISVSGGTRSFAFGKAFNTTGLKVIAKYENNSTKTVTSSAVIDSSSYNKDVSGDYLINVSYTEKEVTKSTSYTVTVKEEGAQDSYTILLYLCGSDLESYDDGSSGYEPGYGSQATGNLKEILSIKNMIPDDVNIIVQTGGAAEYSDYWSDTTYPGWDNEELSKAQSGLSIKDDKLQRWSITSAGMKQIGNDIANASMGEKATFQSFLQWGLENYPADKTGVIMWDHGGAMEGCCYDQNYSYDTLTPLELKNAVQQVFSNLHRTEKLEWIGYDCCLMQVADIASFNSSYFNYMIASQESEPGPGWDYDGWIKTICNNSSVNTITLLQSVCDTYFTKVADTYNSYGGQYKGYNNTTLSILDLSVMSTFDSAWEGVATSLKNTSGWSYSSFKTNVLRQSDRFGLDGSSYRFDIFDVEDVISGIKSRYSSVDVSALESAFANLVKYNKIGGSWASEGMHPSGLCFFSKDNGYAWTNGYVTSKSNTAYENWYSIMN